MKLKFPICDGRNEYLLQIESFNEATLREVGITSPVMLYDIVLERVSGKEISSFGTLSTISNILRVFINDNPTAVLYFYCDDMHDIRRGKSHQAMSPQAYRSKLFSTLFDNEKQRAGHDFPYTNNCITISTSEGVAYIHLIAHQSNAQVVDIIRREIQAQGKDGTEVTVLGL